MSIELQLKPTKSLLIAGFVGMLCVPNSCLAYLECKENSKVAEKVICSNFDIGQLDLTLNQVYSAAKRNNPDRRKLALEQRSWLNSKRDKCTDASCLRKVYLSRIDVLEKVRLLAENVKTQPIDPTEANEVCQAIAKVADRGEIDRHQALFFPLSGSVGESPGNAFGLNKAELKALRNPPDHLNGSINGFYKLRTEKGKPARVFVSRFTGGTCATNEVDSLLVESGAPDSESVEDADDTIRWAYWGGGDFPVFFRGRYYMLTADISNSSLVNMVSWIKPNGVKRPLCLMQWEQIGKVLKGKNAAPICEQILGGAVETVAWDPKPADEFNETSSRAGTEKNNASHRTFEDAAVADVLLRKTGVASKVARFTYNSGAGCGSTQTWLEELSPNGTRLDKLEASLPIHEFDAESVNMFENGGKYYVESFHSRYGGNIFSVTEHSLVKLCDVAPTIRTSVKKMFPLE